MPATVKIPPALDPFHCHKIGLDYEAADEARGDCIICGSDSRKFYVNVETGLWSCKNCQESGNTIEFIRIFYEIGKALKADITDLAARRKLLFSETLLDWGVVASPTADEWLVPGFDLEGNITNLYRYVRFKDKHLMWPTKGLTQALFGMNLFDLAKPDVYICEGVFDGMALYELLKRIKRVGEGKYEPTNIIEESCYAKANVIAVPGAGVWLPSWSKLLAGRNVFLLYDNDHPKVNEKTGRATNGAGFSGMQRVKSVIDDVCRAEEYPEHISYLNWGPEGYNPDLPSGFDVRDFLTFSNNGHLPDVIERAANLNSLLSLISPVPGEWTGGEKDGKITKPGEVALKPLPCDNWRDLTNAARKAYKWDDDLDQGFAFGFAIILSTDTVGDQLWGKLLAPPSALKTSLCECYAVNRKHVVVKSTIRGLHSGSKEMYADGKDTSLVNILRGKTLVIKDGDTLMQSPNLKQILSEMRDVYDGASRTDYRHGVRNNYENLRITVLLAGTKTLRRLDDSELGERFLDLIMMSNIDVDKEHDIAIRAIKRAFADVRMAASKGNEIRDSEDVMLLKRLSAGFINYLKDKGNELINAVQIPDDVYETLYRYGKFVAYMRARPSPDYKDEAQVEMCFRLCKQLTRLSNCLAAVLGRNSIDKEIMRRVKRVVMSTSREKSLEICRYLYLAGQEGIVKDKLIALGANDEKEHFKYINFLRKIRVIYAFTLKTDHFHRVRYRLTDEFYNLYHTVVEG